MPEQVANRYDILATLGEGGMGQVLLVKDRVTDRELALKILKADSFSTSQFKQEFWTMTRLKHPHTVEVFDYGQLPEGTPYFTMEVVPGVGLDAVGPMPPEQVREILVQLCRTLGFIHGQGMVHSDIKPENIRLTPEGTVKLMDFGLIQVVGQDSGPIRGTLHYLAPEVIRGERVDPRADLYSLGAVAYQLLTGRPPFPGDRPAEVIQGHLQGTPEPLPPAVPADLAAVVRRMLAKQPMERFLSAGEVLAALGSTNVPRSDVPSLLVPGFIGRDGLIETLDLQLQRLLDAEPTSGVAVRGEPGSGKSRLLTEFRFRVQLAALPYLQGNAAPPGSPYGPFVEILRQLVPIADERCPATLQGAAQVLSQLVPELAERASSPDPQLEPQQNKLRLQNAIAGLLYAVAQRGGLVLLLENLQGLDGASTELLAYILRNRRENPLLVVGTTRDELGPELVPYFESHVLAPLSEAETAAMVGSMLGTDAPDPAFCGAIARITGGNPRFVEDLLAHLVRQDALRHVDGHWRPVGDPDRLELPDGLQGVLLERLSGLSPVARELAVLAAVIGRPFPLDLLVGLLDDLGRAGNSELASDSSLPLDEVFSGLDELARTHVLEQADGRYAFTSDQLREVLYDTLAAADRAVLHERVARRLEAQALGAPGLELTGALAYHYLRSTATDRAIACCLEAGRMGVDLYAAREAKGFLQEGLSLLDAAAPGTTDRALRLEYLGLLGDANRMLGETAEALEVLTEAARLAAELEDHEQCVRLDTSLGKVRMMQARYPEALEHLKAALAGCEGRPVDAMAIRCLATMGRITYFMGDAAGAQQIFERALSLAREANEQYFLGECLAFLGYLLVSSDPERVQEGLAMLDEALANKQLLGDKIGQADAYMLLGNAYLAFGEYPLAEECFQRNQRLNVEIGQRDESIFSLLNLAIVALEMGNFQGVKELASEAHDAAMACGSRYPVCFSLVLLGMAHLHLGQLSESEALISRGLTTAREIANKYLENLILIYQAEYFATIGSWEEARTVGMEALAMMEASGCKEGEIPLLALLGEIFGGLGAYEQGMEFLERADRLASESRSKGGFAKVFKAASALMAYRGNWGKARVYAKQALVLAEEVASASMAGWLNWQLGLCHLATGEPAEAKEQFRDALQVGEELRMPLLVARAHQGLAASDPHRWRSHQQLAEDRIEKLQALLAADRRHALREAWEARDSRRFQEGHAEEEGSGAGAEPRKLDPDRLIQLARLERDHRVAEQLVAFSLEVNRTTVRKEVLSLLAEGSLELCEAACATVLLFRDGEVVPEVQHQAGTEESPASQLARAVAALCLTDGAPVLLPEATDPRLRPSVQTSSRTVIGMPLRVRDEIEGVLVLERATLEGAFTPEDLEVAKAMVQQAAGALANSRLHAEWQDKSRKLTMLNDLARTISTTLVMEEVLSLVVRLTLEVTQAERGFLLLLPAGASSEELICRAASDRQGRDLMAEEKTISRSICQKVLTSGESLRVADAMADEQFQFQKSIMALSLRTVMCVPLIAKNTTRGLLYVDSQAVVHNFTDQDLGLLEAIATHASVAIENADLYSQISRRNAELEEMLRRYEDANLRASTDSLTGLNNRRFFQEQVTRDFAQAQRHRRALSIIMLDIDHFKRFNDMYGHQVGDRVLVAVGHVISQVVRLADVSARYGGEEFIISLPDTDLEGARVVAERIREEIAGTELDDEHGNVIPQITVSLGVSTLNPQDERITDLIERADRALYQAKHDGRNRTETA